MATNEKVYTPRKWAVGDHLRADDMNELAETVAEVEVLAYENSNAIEAMDAKLEGFAPADHKHTEYAAKDHSHPKLAERVTTLESKSGNYATTTALNAAIGTHYVSEFEPLKDEVADIKASLNQYALKSAIPTDYVTKSVLNSTIQASFNPLFNGALSNSSLNQQFAALAAEFENMKSQIKALKTVINAGTAKLVEAGIEGVVVADGVAAEDLKIEDVQGVIEGNKVEGKTIVITGVSADQLVFEIV